jgi:hypothetical protein
LSTRFIKSILNLLTLSDKSNNIYINQKTLKCKNLPVDPWTAKAKPMTQSFTSWRTAAIPTPIRYNKKSQKSLTQTSQ